MGLPLYATQASFKYALKTLYTIVELNMIASYFSYFKCGFCMNDGDHLLAPLVCTYQFPHLYMQHTHIHASVGYASNPTARKPIPPPLMLICLASHIDLWPLTFDKGNAEGGGLFYHCQCPEARYTIGCHTFSESVSLKTLLSKTKDLFFNNVFSKTIFSENVFSGSLLIHIQDICHLYFSSHLQSFCSRLVVYVCDSCSNDNDEEKMLAPLLSRCRLPHGAPGCGSPPLCGLCTAPLTTLPYQTIFHNQYTHNILHFKEENIETNVKDIIKIQNICFLGILYTTPSIVPKVHCAILLA